jgi:hypothetical protein
MPSLLAPQMQMTAGSPDRMIMILQDVGRQEALYLATEAISVARQSMPRVTGATASRLAPIYGDGYFGIYFPDAQTWFMERGTRAFTMRSLAGKTIPMWVNDFDGSLRAKDPKARTRETQDGRTQVLIFRRAARMGQRKLVRKVDKVSGQVVTTTTVASYPGAPGRISRRQPGMPWTSPGARGGQITGGNVGVRWRHPGIPAMQFLNGALARTAFEASLPIQTVYAVDGANWEHLLDMRLRIS